MLKVCMWILIIISPFLVSCLYYFLYYYFVKEMRFKKGEYKYIGHGSIIKRILKELPKQLILDRFDREPDRFTEFGVHIIAGKQRKW